jgi:hypothetical protein
VYTLVDPSFESDTESVEGGFPAHDPSGPASGGRVERPDSEIDAFDAACSFGKWPRARTARRIRALSDSIAFVEYTMRRIPGSNCKNGTNSGHADSHMRMTAGYFAQVSVNSPKRSRAAASVEAV